MKSGAISSEAYFRETGRIYAAPQQSDFDKRREAASGPMFVGSIMSAGSGGPAQKKQMPSVPISPATPQSGPAPAQQVAKAGVSLDQKILNSGATLETPWGTISRGVKGYAGPGSIDGKPIAAGPAKGTIDGIPARTAINNLKAQADYAEQNPKTKYRTT